MSPLSHDADTMPQNASTSVTGEAVAEALPEFDTEALVEAAEQLLREGAPHDFDLLIVGSGPGGYTAALRAAQQGARVGLIESREIGGVHINRGSLPAKALLESASLLRLLQRADAFGLRASATFDFPTLWQRRETVAAEARSQIEAHLEAVGVKILRGRAAFVEPHTLEISRAGASAQRVSAVNVLLATGAVPARLQVPGVDLPGVLSTRQIWELEALPASLAIIGAGALGVEFAYLFAHLGVRVTLIDQASHVLPLEDPDIAREMERALREAGLDVRTGTKLLGIEADTAGFSLSLESDGPQWLRAEKILITAGRKPNTEHLKLDAAGIAQRQGRILVDEHCQTNVPGVYAVGDCTRGAGWAHQAMAEGAHVADIVTGYAPQTDLGIVPHVYFTQPEVATVGMGERAADWAGLQTRVGTCHFHANGRAVAAGDGAGFVKIIADANDGCIIGCQIIGPRASELINQAALAIAQQMTARELAAVPFACPTLGECLNEAARRAQGHEPPGGELGLDLL